MAARLVLLSLIVGGALLGTAHGCSPSSNANGDSDANVTITDAGAASEANIGDGPHCSIPPKPSGMPEGWELYTDYDPCCLVYVPSDPKYLPPPLQWAACNAAWAGDSGIDSGCRQIDQPSAASPAYGAASVRNGVVTVLTSEVLNGFGTYVTADVDGPTHQALMVSDPKSACGPVPEDMRDGKYVYSVYPGDNFNGGGFLAGDVDEFRPSFIHHFNDSITHSVAAGALGVLDVDQSDTFNFYAWTQTPTIIRNSQDVGLQYSFPFFSSNAIFWAATDDTYLRVGEIAPPGAAMDLLSFGTDSTQGAGDLGTDGVNMVWVEASGRATPTSSFVSASYMTAPFTNDPSKVAKRRLRSENPRGLSALPTIVGCGFAARSTLDSNGRINGLRLLRISDGTSWQLYDDASTPWIWTRALAITCNEVFTSVATGANATNIARVSIASLGPGIPAD